MDTSGVGTRIAMAENLPFISGKASVTAEAAPVQTVVTAEQCLVREFPSNNHKPVVPVSVITMLSTAERPRRSCLWKLSIRFWSLVKECTVSMWPDWKAEEGRRKGRVAGPQTKALAHSYSPQCRIAPEQALALVQWRWWYKKQRNRFAATKDAGIHNVVITVADTHSDRLGGAHLRWRNAVVIDACHNGGNAFALSRSSENHLQPLHVQIIHGFVRQCWFDSTNQLTFDTPLDFKCFSKPARSRQIPVLSITTASLMPWAV